MKLIKLALIKLIDLYRLVLSPDTGYFKFMLFGGCRFTPTCSHYCQMALEKYDIVTALRMSFKRILYCHPFSNKEIIDYP